MTRCSRHSSSQWTWDLRSSCSPMSHRVMASGMTSGQQCSGAPLCTAAVLSAHISALVSTECTNLIGFIITGLQIIILLIIVLLHVSHHTSYYIHCPNKNAEKNAYVTDWHLIQSLSLRFNGHFPGEPGLTSV